MTLSLSSPSLSQPLNPDLLGLIIIITSSLVDPTSLSSWSQIPTALAPVPTYNLGKLLEFALFLWLRKKHPSLKKPFPVPMGMSGLVCIRLVPSTLLIFAMALASWKVFMISIGLTLLALESTIL